MDMLIARRWQEGPEWLKLNPSEWPIANFKYRVDEIKTEINGPVLNENSSIDTELFTLVAYFSRETNAGIPEYTPQVSKFIRVVGAFGWVKLFIRNCKR